jgi:hypothetical protein
MRYDPYSCDGPQVKRRFHRLECRHRIEVEVYPNTGQVYFADERSVDSACTQFRFQATVFNSKTAEVHWSVESINGGPGAGTIDARGLYLAPKKNGHSFPFTEIIVARSAEDPDRKAMATITVAGKGPLDPPPAVIRLSPRRCTIYREGVAPQNRCNNEYIDKGNYCRTFCARLFNRASAIRWRVDNVIQVLPSYGDTTIFTYYANSSTTVGTHRVRAELIDDTNVYDEAEVVVTDYGWGGLWT